jgi:hypothetical protein
LRKVHGHTSPRGGVQVGYASEVLISEDTRFSK